MASEAQLQRAVMQYLALALPNDAVAFHPANEGKRSARQGADLKRQGMLPGLPDIFVIWRGRICAIELKAPRGRVKDIQHAMLKRLLFAGCGTAICRSIDEVEGALIHYGFPLARTGAAPVARTVLEAGD